jgi:hypothetical protein
MKKILFISMSILAALSFLRAADQPAVQPKDKLADEEPAVEPKTKLAANQPAIELKNKSAFTVENGSRTPFWPIGFKPTARVSRAGAERAVGDVPPSAFLVTTITLDPGARFAIINGKAMMEGQQFGLQLGSQTYQITVKRIEDGRVILGRRDQEIVVPLRRK